MSELRALRSGLNASIARVAQEERRRRLAEEAMHKAKEKIRKLEEERSARLAAETKSLVSDRSALLQKLAAALGDREDIRIEGDRLVFYTQVLFDAGSIDLSASDLREIQSLAESLKVILNDAPPSVDWLIRVDGHADANEFWLTDISYGDLWDLSQARARSVVREFVGNYALPPEKFVAVGFGASRPVGDTQTPKARSLNRRIEIKLTEY